MKKIVYNLATGEFACDDETSRAYALPDGFQQWWTIGYYEWKESNCWMIRNFFEGIEKINRLKKSHQRELLPVEKVKYLWAMYGYFAKLTDEGVAKIEKII